MIKDSSGYSIVVKYDQEGAFGELALGQNLVTAPPGIGLTTMVDPLVKQPVVMAPMAEGMGMGAIVRLPTDISLAGLEFKAQGMIFTRAASTGMMVSNLMEISFVPDETQLLHNRSGIEAYTGLSFTERRLEGTNLGTLIEMFSGSDSDQAGPAYLELYHRGKASVDSLLELAHQPFSAERVWSGHDAFESPWTSVIRLSDSEVISVRRMAIYLLSAIAMGIDMPYGMNELSTVAGVTSPAAQLDEIALEAMDQWWADNGELPLVELYELRRPLLFSGVDFGSPQGRRTELLDESLIIAPDTPLPRSATGQVPYVQAGDQYFFGATLTSKAAEMQAAIDTCVDEKGGVCVVQAKRPYNCLSWAVHCDMCHGWVQPPTLPGMPIVTSSSVDNWMMMNGFSMTPPAGGASQTVMIQKHTNPIPMQSYWTHAMKKNPTSPGWSSKNGKCALYSPITDPMAFGNSSYPPPAGEMNTFETWYK